MTLAEIVKEVESKVAAYEEAKQEAVAKVAETKAALEVSERNRAKALADGKQTEYHTYNAEVNYYAAKLEELQDAEYRFIPYSPEEFASAKASIRLAVARETKPLYEQLEQILKTGAPIVDQIQKLYTTGNHAVTAMNGMIPNELSSFGSIKEGKFNIAPGSDIRSVNHDIVDGFCNTNAGVPGKRIRLYIEDCNNTIAAYEDSAE